LMVAVMRDISIIDGGCPVTSMTDSCFFIRGLEIYLILRWDVCRYKGGEVLCLSGSSTGVKLIILTVVFSM
jgi:hypothetical protein